MELNRKLNWILSQRAGWTLALDADSLHGIVLYLLIIFLYLLISPFIISFYLLLPPFISFYLSPLPGEGPGVRLSSTRGITTLLSTLSLRKCSPSKSSICSFP